MSEEAGQRTMLYFFEILMNMNKPVSLSYLMGHFTKRSFTAEMRFATGGTESGLRNLFSKYPSIFTLQGNCVGLTDWQTSNDSNSISRESSDSDLTNNNKNSFIPNVSAEMEAVKFFQDKFIKRSSREMAVKSLAGHLSQASLSIRKVVGPQLQFRSWLLRHPHIFEVEGENVRLQDDVAALILDVDLTENEILCCQNHTSQKSKSELMAIVFLGDLIKQHPGLKTTEIQDKIGLAPTEIQNFINSKNVENFVQTNSSFFSIENEVICEVKSPNHGLVRVNDLEKVEISEEENLAGAIIGKGRIYHIAKLWGIIDLGQHDHVFFDRSILPKSMLDLKKEYKVGQILCFKALPAPKTSRARWKAVKVWKPTCYLNNLDDLDKSMSEDTSKVEEEIYRLVLADHPIDDILSSDDENSWNDVYGETPLKNGVDEIKASELHSLESDEKADSVGGENNLNSSVQHSNHHHDSQAKNGHILKYVSVACQTHSTGDIIATQLYQA